MLTTTKMTPSPQRGSETSSERGSSRQEMLTSGQSPMCKPTTSGATRNVISSRGLADGLSRCDKPDGLTTDLFGRAHAHANPLAQPGRARRSQTNVTFGLSGFLSSRSADLQQSLESKLKRQLDGVGSTLFSLTWRKKATPAGRPYFQHVASVRRTSGTDFGSWPTPTAAENAGDLEKKASRRAKMKEKWRGASGNGFGHSMAELAQLSGWPTPNVADDNNSRWKDAPAASRARLEKSSYSNLAITAQALSPDSGRMPAGFHVQTEKPGQLDPDHSRWVMGYETEHLNCAPTETRSFLKSRRNSSPQQARL